MFVDTEDNKLKILSGATAITSKIRRTTIGIIDLTVYALKTDIKELPNVLINDITLMTTLNDYALKDDLTEYRKIMDLEFTYEKQLTITNGITVIEPYESGYTYTIKTERGEFEFKDAEVKDDWAIIRPNKIIDWITPDVEIILIYWYSKGYSQNYNRTLTELNRSDANIDSRLSNISKKTYKSPSKRNLIRTKITFKTK